MLLATFPLVRVYELKRRGIPVCLVNGWLYGGKPSSFVDRIERALFGREYLRLLDLVTVQNDDVRSVLVRCGVDPSRVVVTGNAKFDAMATEPWTPRGKRSERLLRGMVESSRPCLVAGCVTDLADQRETFYRRFVS